MSEIDQFGVSAPRARGDLRGHAIVIDWAVSIRPNRRYSANLIEKTPIPTLKAPIDFE